MAVILLIENEPALRKTLARMLHMAGHDVREASDGKEGLRLLKSIEPEIILTDIFMPNADGIEVIAENRQRQNPAKLIAMTGASGLGLDYLKVAAELGADRTLRKPFRLTALKETIDACLSGQADSLRWA